MEILNRLIAFGKLTREEARALEEGSLIDYEVSVVETFHTLICREQGCTFSLGEAAARKLWYDYMLDILNKYELNYLRLCKALSSIALIEAMVNEIPDEAARKFVVDYLSGALPKAPQTAHLGKQLSFDFSLPE